MDHHYMLHSHGSLLAVGSRHHDALSPSRHLAQPAEQDTPNPTFGPNHDREMPDATQRPKRPRDDADDSTQNTGGPQPRLSQHCKSDNGRMRDVLIQGIKLVSTKQMSPMFQPVFSFPNFNAVQSKCFPSVFLTDDNFVLSSPTGSGKTVIFELAICRLIHQCRSGDYKIVYQAPTKSLCAERQRDWQRKFEPMGLKCTEVTGDTDQTQLSQVRNAGIIITTPEKWDSLTRKWKDHAMLMRLIKLFLIDEVHMVKDDRGATLEAVVSRMKSIGAGVRFLALSATIPNAEDIASWLGRNSTSQHIPAQLEQFGDEFRPVVLRKHVHGYRSSNPNMFAFDKSLNSRLPEIIQKYSCKKPIMVFCCTRKISEQTAHLLSDWWKQHSAVQRYWNGPSSSIPVRDSNLQDCVSAGVAFHHAGMDLADRAAVEQRYLKGDLHVICCTSTLAVGINLPCHLVIIKGTTAYEDGVARELSELEVLQMLGRAGRPQFDSSAVAIIMTRQENYARWDKLVSGKEILESCFHDNLIEHLNAEFVLGTIHNVESATCWLRETFLYIRLCKNPRHYRLIQDDGDENPDNLLNRICREHVQQLQDIDLISQSDPLKSTAYGNAVAQYYVRFETAKRFISLPEKARLSEILSLVSQAEELKDIRFRAGEKGAYKDLNSLPGIRFPIPVSLELPAHKVSLIIQSALGGVDLPVKEEGSNIMSRYLVERSAVLQQAKRLIRCIADFAIERSDSIALRNVLMLCRSIAAQGWDDLPLQMKQVNEIGIASIRKLTGAGIKSIHDLEQTDQHRIESILGRAPPFGRKIHESLKAFPNLRVTMREAKRPSIKNGQGADLDLEAEIAFMNEYPSFYFNKTFIYVIFLAETSDGRLVNFARISSKKIQKPQKISFSAHFSSPTQSIISHVMCEEIAGTKASATYQPTIPSYAWAKPTSNEKVRRQALPAKQQGGTNDPKLGIAKDNITAYFYPSQREDRRASASRDDIADNQISRSSSNEFNLAAPLEAEMESYTTQFERYLSATRTNGNTFPIGASRNETQDRERLENGNFKCNHRCNDKKNCSHKCCKEGLLRAPQRPRQPARQLDHLQFHLMNAPYHGEGSPLYYGNGYTPFDSSSGVHPPFGPMPSAPHTPTPPSATHPFSIYPMYNNQPEVIMSQHSATHPFSICPMYNNQLEGVMSQHLATHTPSSHSMFNNQPNIGIPQQLATHTPLIHTMSISQPENAMPQHLATRTPSIHTMSISQPENAMPQHTVTYIPSNEPIIANQPGTGMLQPSSPLITFPYDYHQQQPVRQVEHGNFNRELYVQNAPGTRDRGTVMYDAPGVGPYDQTAYGELQMGHCDPAMYDAQYNGQLSLPGTPWFVENYDSCVNISPSSFPS